MAMHNAEIAQKFNDLADLLELQNANPFRIRAYRNAAHLIFGLGKNISDLILQGEDLTELPGIGEDLAEKIKTLVKTGELPLLQETAAKTPAVLIELMKIEGLGPKRVQLLYKKLKIKNVDDLKIAIEKGKLRKIRGFGEKSEQKILQNIEHSTLYAKRFKLADTFPIVNELLNYLRKVPSIEHLDCAGSFRRRKETVGDIDILATTQDAKKVIDHFVKFPEVANIISQGTTRAAIHLHSGLQVDLRVIPTTGYGAALIYFTGSKEHNIAIRKIAVQKKLKLNEYGVFKGEKQIAGQTEADVYAQIGLSFIDPELREDRGEIEASQQNRLPHLINLKDLRGDLHCHSHTIATNPSLETMALAAQQLGYEYAAISDHTQYLRDRKKSLLEYLKNVDQLNKKLKMTVLKTVEVSIKEDGTLDLPNTLLKEFDVTICTVQSHFDLSQEQQTERIIRAMDNPYFKILAHPTGRLILQRDPYPLDMEKLLLTATERKKIMELNAQPDRLDLNDVHCLLAKELGVKIALSTAANDVQQLHDMQYGIYQARRGWLEKQNVINTLPLKELQKILSA